MTATMLLFIFSILCNKPYAMHFEKKSLYDFSRYVVEKSKICPETKIPKFFTDKNPILDWQRENFVKINKHTLKIFKIKVPDKKFIIRQGVYDPETYFEFGGRPVLFLDYKFDKNPKKFYLREFIPQNHKKEFDYSDYIEVLIALEDARLFEYDQAKEKEERRKKKEERRKKAIYPNSKV